MLQLVNIVSRCKTLGFCCVIWPFSFGKLSKMEFALAKYQHLSKKEVAVSQ